MKRLALFAMLAACLGLWALAAPPDHAQNDKKQSSDCGGPRQEPCPEPPPDDPPSDPSAPFAEAPLCETHDPTIWHGVFDPESGCHYQHHHGVNPATTPFAAYVASWPALFEGELHEGYKFLFFESPDGSCQRFDQFGEGCVLAVLLRVHDAGTIAHLTVRRHSNRVIALVSNQALTQFGVVEMGLLTDYGVTHCPYKQEQCELPDDPWTMAEAGDAWEQPPYTSAHTTESDVDRLRKKGANPQFWQSLGPNASMFEFFDPVPNRNLQLAFSAADAWGLINRGDYASGSPSENFLGAPNFTDGFNQSRFCVFNVRLFLPEGVGPGFTGWTDDFGRLNPNCSTFGPNCWPLNVSADAPALSTFSWSISVQQDCSTAPTNEFDVCFDGSGNQVDCRLGGTSAGWLRPPGH